MVIIIIIIIIIIIVLGGGMIRYADDDFINCRRCCRRCRRGRRSGSDSDSDGILVLVLVNNLYPLLSISCFSSLSLLWREQWLSDLWLVDWLNWLIHAFMHRGDSSSIGEEAGGITVGCWLCIFFLFVLWKVKTKTVFFAGLNIFL